MARKRFWYGMPVTVLLLGIVFAGCNGGGPGILPGGDGNKAIFSVKAGDTEYTLEITENSGSRAYVPAAGDAYTLTIKIGANIRVNTGTVVSFTGGVFKLQPSNENEDVFDIGTSGSAIISITGTIVMDDGSTVVDPPLAGNGVSSYPLGENLTLCGQIWTVEQDQETYVFSYQLFTGSREVIAQTRDFDTGALVNIGGSGAVADGHFTFTIGEPSFLQSINKRFDEDFAEDFGSVRISDETAQITVFQPWISTITGSRLLQREDRVSTDGYEETWYMYVDRDVTVSSDGSVRSEEEDGITGIMTYNAVSVDLKAGWNAFLYTEEIIKSPTSIAYTVTLSAASPDHHEWVFFDH